MTCPDTAAPDTTITGQPKAKTKKKKATFTFDRLRRARDRGFRVLVRCAPFSSCTSPITVKGKKGSILRRPARDAAGNVDATPATYSWKVKKKKK